ncbi:hypothetical protein BAX97_06515 [Elizabethkingia meningoseptica]|uniref:nucleoid-associated protein n=1 Tax=Elizabethkingia meningoseptica TaxID=238 RepID=UPI000999A228|nr:nucleoid-associated protein [Elizabethkingia meningoseptica]OPC28707.1 hypothetical protein BAX97_06515 [Elizabethkingia meningoseptica]
MINNKDTYISNISLQGIGNKYQDKENIYCKNELSITELDEVIFRNFFLSPFKKQLEIYQFSHYTGDLHLNVLFSLCQDFFDGILDFIGFSNSILDHLAHISSHPNIKIGELFIVHFEDIEINNINTNAIGIFKLENKRDFLNFTFSNSSIDFLISKGYKLDSIDKGCLIFNTNDNGYKILSIDDNKVESDYWKNGFLGVDYLFEKSFQTKEYVSLLKDFSNNIFKSSEKKVKNEFLGNTLKFLDKNESFSDSMLEEGVLQNYNVVDEFKEYKTQFEEAKGYKFPDTLEVSKQVLNYQKRKIKSEIKLDTDIQIKVDINNPISSERYIEKGFDNEKNMYFYKLFYNNEI